MEVNKKIKDYLDEVFKPYENNPVIKELKEELLFDLQEKYSDFRENGFDEETSYFKTVNSLGDISEIIDSISEKTSQIHQKINLNFSMSDLKESKLDSVSLKAGNFNFSDFANADFNSSDLSGSSFKSSNMKKVNFNKAILKNSIFKYSDLEKSDFRLADITEGKFIKSSLKGADFTNSILTKTEFDACDITDAKFDNLELTGTIFIHSELRKASFRNATLRLVTFKSQVKRAIFDGASMDKVTYALLKGYKADLTNVKII